MSLGDRFKRLDQSLDLVDERLASTQAKSDNDPTLVHKLRMQVRQLERKLQTLPESAPLDSSKNDMKVGSAETQQPAEKGKRRRRKRPHAEAADATADEEDSRMTATQRMQRMTATQHALKTGPQHPRPPALNHASGNGKTASQQERGGRFDKQERKRDPEPTDESATPLPKAKKQQDDAPNQAASSRDQQGRGRGWNHHHQHGWGRGRGRGRGRGGE